MQRFMSPPLEAIQEGPIKDTVKVIAENIPIEWEIYTKPFLNGERPDCILLHPEEGIIVVQILDFTEERLRTLVSRIPRFNIVQALQEGRITTKEYSRFKRECDNLRNEQLNIRYVKEILDIGLKEGWLSRDGYQSLLEAYTPNLAGSNEELAIFKQAIYRLKHLQEVIADLYCPRLGEYSGLSKIKIVMSISGVSQKFIDQYLHNYWELLFDAKLRSSVELLGFDAFSSERTRAKTLMQGLKQASDSEIPDLIRDLRNWLTEPYFSESERHSLSIDSKQENLIVSRTQSGYRRIKGAAGTGKSLVLAARAAVLFQENKKVLVVTFNITLIEYLRRLATRFFVFNLKKSLVNPIGLTFLNFHYLCKLICYELGEHQEYEDLFLSKTTKLVLDTKLSELVDQLISEKGVPSKFKFDAILVDEGQDFLPLWWNVLRKLTSKDPEMVLCADRTQDLYQRSTSWTDAAMRGAGFLGDWSSLESSYRMPETVRVLAENFISQFFESVESEKPKPVERLSTLPNMSDCLIEWLSVDSKDLAARCAHQAVQLVTKVKDERFVITDVVVIVPNRALGIQVDEILKHQYKIEAITTFSKEKKSAKEKYYEERRKKMAFSLYHPGIKITTIHSFKGWESRAVVLAVDRFSTLSDKKAMYAGLTRVVAHPYDSYLTIIYTSPNFFQGLQISSSPA